MHHEKEGSKSIHVQNRKKRRQEIALFYQPGTTGEDASWPWKIPLTQGRFTLVDEEDYIWASKHKWCFSTSTGYALRSLPRVNGKKRHQYLHRAILGDRDGHCVDHINCQRLDNRRKNLRHATASESQRNKLTPRNNKSGFKGVIWNKMSKKWTARITVKNKSKFIGNFLSADEAYEAYKKAARTYFGEFANV